MGGIVHGRATGRFMEGCGCGCVVERERCEGEGEREQEQEGQSSACHFFGLLLFGGLNDTCMELVKFYKFL